MNTDDVNVKALTEKVANILMERIKERDEVFMTRLKYEIVAIIRAAFEKK